MSVLKNPKWLESAVFYQIYPQSFKDSNGNGIGDIPGIIRKLDYLVSLGINAIWLNPCFVSPFQDAGYDVADYYRVSPRYGTIGDLRRLFKEAHNRGIRVCLDLVPGHTSIEHPWFKASCRHKRNRYSDRYIWTNSVWDGGSADMKFISGYAERDGNFAINFFYAQPALNYGFAKPDPLCPWQQPINSQGPRTMRAELRNIISFWLDKGADGFRVDMAFSLVKNDPNRKMTIRLWQEIRQWLERYYPEAVLIAEWANPSEAIPAGFHVDFLLPFGVPGYLALFFNRKEQRCFFDSRGEGNIYEFLDEYQRQYRKSRRGYISIPSGNHDMRRLSAGRTRRELEVIFAFLMTWPGVPFIYYGDEIGMRYIRGLPSKEGGYGRTGSRTPMQWDNTKNAGFSSAPPSKLYIPIDSHKNRPTVKAQNQRPSSLLNLVRRLIALRKSSPALQANGKLIPLYAKPDRYPFIFLRHKGRKRFLVAINPADRPVTTSFDAKDLNITRLEIGRGVTIAKRGGRMKVTMDAVSYGIFSEKRS